MTLRFVVLACVFATLFFTRPLASLSAPPPAPSGSASALALAYAQAVGSGDYAKAYTMLTPYLQRYYRSVDNYASVFKADHFHATGLKVLRTTLQKGVQFVVIGEEITYLDQAAQLDRTSRATFVFAVVKNGGTYRVADEGHPYREYSPSDVVVQHDGVKLTVRRVAFFERRVQVLISFENQSDDFVTFLPYGRSVLQEGSTVYRVLQTRNWLLTDRQLFLGLRLAGHSRYTGALSFQTPPRLGDRANTFTLRVAPALREGGDQPLEFALPPIAVPAP